METFWVGNYLSIETASYDKTLTLYSVVVTIYTTNIKLQQFYTVQMCLIWISKQTPIIALHSDN